MPKWNMTTWSPLYMAPVGLFSCHRRECNINLNRWQSVVIFHSDIVLNGLDRSSLEKRHLAWLLPNLNMCKHFASYLMSAIMLVFSNRPASTATTHTPSAPPPRADPRAAVLPAHPTARAPDTSLPRKNRSVWVHLRGLTADFKTTKPEYLFKTTLQTQLYFYSWWTHFSRNREEMLPVSGWRRLCLGCTGSRKGPFHNGSARYTEPRLFTHMPKML